jgi:hypothetical protein
MRNLARNIKNWIELSFGYGCDNNLPYSGDYIKKMESTLEQSSVLRR